MTTLISFLGKHFTGEYRTANYRFASGQTFATPFFGQALLQELKPDRLILLGTAGSMWDVFFINESAGEVDEAALDEIVAAAEEARVTQEMLDAQARVFAEQLGLPVNCQLISYARNTQEQVTILSSLADLLSEGEEIILDVTHSFRHLPMLAMVAARYLKHVRQVVVKDIYYGALEMSANNETPVLQLGGMLAMLDWVDALAIHDHDGSYRQFTGLLGHPDMAQTLAKAQFQEQIGRIGQARKPLRKVLNQLQDANPLSDPMLQLFAPQLRERLQWSQGENYSQRQAELARRYLATSQYARAIEMGYEAFVSKLTQERGGEPERYADRQETKEYLESEKPARTWNAYKNLRSLRNAVAHGTRADVQQTQQALASDKALHDHVEQLFATLFD